MSEEAAIYGNLPVLRTYTGTKTIKAASGISAEEAIRFGAQITEETARKNHGVEGYLVDYPDGYRSWSPKKAFEDAYRLSETYVDRMKIEYEDLKKRYMALQEFLYSEDARNLDHERITALTIQSDVMRRYLDVLNARIEIETRDPNDEKEESNE